VVNLSAIGRIGDRPEDAPDQKLKHRFLVYMGILMSCGGLMWGTLALAYGLWWPSVIPYAYAVITAGNMWYFHASKNFLRVRFVQVLISLMLPFLFQWSLGGFHASGAVMLWAMLSIVGALTFTDLRTMVKWLAVYTVLTVLSGVFDGYLEAEYAIDVGRRGQIGFITLNIAVISNIVFGLMLYMLYQREKAKAALATARERIEGLEQEVADARPQDLSGGGVDVVIDSHMLECLLVRVEDPEARAVVAISGLADAADVDDPLLVVLKAYRLARRVLHAARPQQVLVCQMAVPDKVELRQLLKDLQMGLRVLATDYVKEAARHDRRRVEEAQVVHLVGVRQAVQPAEVVLRQLVARPEQRIARGRVVVLGVHHPGDRGVVVAHQRHTGDRPHELAARVGVRAVPDDVTQADVLVNAIEPAVVEDRRQRFMIAVDV